MYSLLPTMSKDEFSVQHYLESLSPDLVLSILPELVAAFQKQGILNSKAMPSLFCCGSVQPYRPQILSHEPKLRAFQSWAAYPRDSTASQDAVDLLALKPEFAVQLVRQVNYGPLESKRYFVPNGSNDGGFVEISENDLIQANFQKLNA